MALPQPLPRVPATEEIVPEMERIIKEYNTTRSCILQSITPTTATFDNVMGPLAQVENAAQGRLGMIDMLQYGSPSLATQGAFDEARKLYLKARALWTADKDFFKLLQAAKENPNFQALDSESQHLLEKEILEYKHAGYGIVQLSELEQYQKFQMEIANLEREFQQNVAMEAGGMRFTIQELDGVPEDELAKWSDDPNEEAGTNGNQHQTTKFVPFANGGTLAILTHAHSPNTRKRMFLADNLKLRENKPIFEEIIKRRARQAQLLKYGTYADFRIEKRMAKSTEWVKDLLDQLRATLCPLGRAEIALLQYRRLEDLRARGIHGGELEGKGFPPWDKRYYEQMIQREFEIDQLKIAEFFPLENTATNMLGIFASLLGLRFDSIPADKLTGDLIWHESIRCFSVWDARNQSFIGYLYFDLLWRENKYRGNQSVNIQCGYLRPDETRQYPSTILMCSFPTPTPKSCALLKHHQVVTLFHEMGHGIHDLLAQTRYVRFHGYRLPPDFGEMPSVMLENWCWMKDVVKGLSCHYTTLDGNYLIHWRNQHPGKADPPVTIPDEMVECLIKHRYSNRGLYHLYQLSISVFDLQIHSLGTNEEISELDIQKLWYDLREEIEGMDFADCRDGFAFGTFTHLTAGYDVCYYAYLCCTALAQDLFSTVFADDPCNKFSWDRYRHGVLEYGGSQQDLMCMLENFLGRPPNTNALVECLVKAKDKN